LIFNSVVFSVQNACTFYWMLLNTILMVLCQLLLFNIKTLDDEKVTKRCASHKR